MSLRERRNVIDLSEDTPSPIRVAARKVVDDVICLGLRPQGGDDKSIQPSPPKRPRKTSHPPSEPKQPFSSSSSSSSSRANPVYIQAPQHKDASISFSDLRSLVLDVFPDCSATYATDLLKRFRVTEDYHVPPVLAHMVDKGYERDEGYGKKRRDEMGMVATAAGAQRKWRRDFENRNWEASKGYEKEALEILADDFKFATPDSLGVLFRGKGGGKYWPTYKVIFKALESGAEDKENSNQSGKFWSSKLPSLPEVSRSKLRDAGVVFSKRPRKVDLNRGVTDEDLCDEIEYAKSKVSEAKEAASTLEARRISRRAAEEADALIECNCCYDDVSFEEMTQCTDGHLFCVSCLERYTSENLFGQQKTTLKCMSVGDDGKPCSGGFTQQMLERALPKKVLKKLDEAIFTNAVEKAGVEDLCRCPECDFQAMLPEGERIFRCPAPGCFFESCKDCGEPPHFPLKCDEVEKRAHLDSRKKVEEAMTTARIRECPGCKKRFFKVEGCNKMTCACGVISCYVCRAKVDKLVGYKHFCQVTNCLHKDCKKCPLFTNSVEDDRQAMREAGIKAMHDAGKGWGEEKMAESKLDVDQLLEKSDKAKRDAMGRAARLAQQNAHLGVGAMARAAYNEIDGVGRGAAAAGQG